MSSFVHDVVSYEFLQKALLTATAVGIVCGVIGCFIVLRGLSLMGDAISHAVLPGVAISYMLGIGYFIGAFLFGIFAALSIGFVHQNSRIKTDSSIGIIFSGFLALGILLVVRAQSATDLTQILFGNILSVRSSDMWLTLAVSTIVLGTVLVFYKELLVSTFDATMAEVYGLKTRLIHYALMVMLTLVTVASLQTVGVILVVSLLITPASTAYLLTNRMPVMISLSAIFGAISAVTGMYLSFRYNLSSGAVIVLVATVIFLFVFFLEPRNGLLGRRLRLSRRSRRTVSDSADQ